MIQIKRFVSNPIGENCYLVWDETHQCAIIDCGAFGKDKETKISQFIEENRLSPILALQTHMHFDHVLGLPFLNARYALLPSYHAEDMSVYESSGQMARMLFGIDDEIPILPVREFLAEGQYIPLGNTCLKVIHTPGHTPGGLMFYQPEEKLLFSGDTLFQGSIGRTDLPGGSYEQEICSVREKVLTLPDDVRIYPGHGPSTSVGDERRINPYF